MDADERAMVALAWTVAYFKALKQIWHIALCPCDMHARIREHRH